MMKNTRLGFFTTSGIMAAVLTALIVTGFAFASGGMLFSPGRLNAQAGAPLGGVNSHAEIAGQCNLCHAPFWGPSSMTDRCVVCHTDVAAQWQDTSTLHGMLRLNNPTLACRNCHPDHRGPDLPLIDLGNARFPHFSFRFSLNAHQFKTNGEPFGCNDCHAQVYTRFDQSSCSTCHAQFEAAFIQTHSLDFGTDCLACHDGVDSYGHNFNHSGVPYELIGKHAQVKCGECHLNTHTLADLKAAPQDCASCHAVKDPHQGRLGSDCGTCHTPAGWAPALFDHNLSTFKLDGQHVNVACKNCHIEHVLQGTPSDCYACHAEKDTHEGRLGTNCGSCHTTAGWTPATFDHNLSTFKLTGKHIPVACDSCHIDNVLHGIPSDCYACHAGDDTHQGSLGTACGTCHTPTGWTPATYNHNLSVFKLTGQHIKVACLSCHVNNLFRGTPTNCNACHAADDNHQGQFGTNCGSCHSTSAWLPATFDHNLSTFKLTGQHVNVTCTGCHINNVYRGTPNNCKSCHTEPSGHFGSDCASCHTTSNWNGTYSHTGFPLTGAHTNLGCQQCHSGGSYGGLSTACSACHTEPAGHYGSNCANCHSTSNWNASYSHSGFPLNGGHSGLNCTQCHSGGGFGGLSTACSACHTEPSGHYGSNCAQCHTTSNWNASFNHPLGCANHEHATCTDCHTVNYSSATCTTCHENRQSCQGD